jgi:hypothetical protein
MELQRSKLWMTEVPRMGITASRRFLLRRLQTLGLAQIEGSRGLVVLLGPAPDPVALRGREPTFNFSIIQLEYLDNFICDLLECMIKRLA